MSDFKDKYKVDKTLLEMTLPKISKNRNGKLSFLLIGQTGVGKSSVVNALFGNAIAMTDDYEPCTMKVTSYEMDFYGIKIQLIDTPGLCDYSNEGRDEEILNKLAKEIREFDAIWYVSRIDSTRITSDEKRALYLIGKAFKSFSIECIIFIFTHSRFVEFDKFNERLEYKTAFIKDQFVQYFGQKVSNKISSLALDTSRNTNPNGKEWLGDLYKIIFESIPLKRTKVFISYSHFDKIYFDDIKKHFKPFMNSIDIWDDTKILPGQRWKEEINAAISETKVAILLISADFLGSDFIVSKELPPLLDAAERNGATILTVILKPCLIDEFPEITKFQALNSFDKPVAKLNDVEKDELYVKLVRHTKRILEN